MRKEQSAWKSTRNVHDRSRTRGITTTRVEKQLDERLGFAFRVEHGAATVPSSVYVGTYE